MRAAPRPEPVREPEEVFLVDRAQHCGRRPLDDLVLERRDRERSLPPIRLGYVDPPGGLRPVRSPMQPRVQVLEIALEVCLVGRPGQPVHAGCCVRLEFAECLPEVLDADMVEQRSEPLLLPLPCSSPYAVQRLCHGFPAWHPARALLARIPLGLRPWLNRFRNGSLRIVHRLHGYYGGVRLPAFVHHRLRLLTFPMRTAGIVSRRPDAGSPSFRRDPFVRDGVSDHGRAAAPRMSALLMLPSAVSTDSASARSNFRGSIAHPARSLCTLRRWSCLQPRNTRYQAGAAPYLDRIFTGWIAPAFWRTDTLYITLFTPTSRSFRQRGRPHSPAPWLFVPTSVVAAGVASGLRVASRTRPSRAGVRSSPRPEGAPARPPRARCRSRR